MSIIEISGLKDIFHKLDSIKVRIDDFFANLLSEIESAEWETGSVRAEFCLRLSDVASLMQIINALFNFENINCL